MGQPRDLDLHYKISPRKLLAVTVLPRLVV